MTALRAFFLVILKQKLHTQFRIRSKILHSPNSTTETDLELCMVYLLHTSESKLESQTFCSLHSLFIAIQPITE